jgi:hypothetical protein
MAMPPVGEPRGVELGLTHLTLEVVIASGEPPWSQTSQFLSDVSSLLRRALAENFDDLDDYEFVLGGVEQGSLHFLGALRRQRPADQAHRPSRARPLSNDTKALIVVGVLTSLFGPQVGSAVFPGPNAQWEPAPTQVQQAQVPDVPPQLLERLDRYVRLHAGHVRMVVTAADGTRYELTLGGDKGSSASRHWRP